MILTIDFNFLRNITATDLLTFLAIILAYLAYRKTIKDKYDSWESLLFSLKADFKSQEAWLSTEYIKENYKDKTAFSPRKIIFPLSFGSVQEIINRGATDIGFSEEFINKISIFKERVDTFNELLTRQAMMSSTNPYITQKVVDALDKIGACDSSVSYENFISSLESLKNSDQESYNFAKRLHAINTSIHAEIISNKNNEDGLHSLYLFLKEEIENKINNMEKSQPWYIRFNGWILILATIVFVVIENLLKI